MNDDEIRYCMTPDGIRIAYSVWGSGEPIVHVIGYPFSHLRASLQIDTLRKFWETIADRAMLIRIDVRGCGLSQRSTAEDWTAADWLGTDIAAVLDKLAVPQASLVGYGTGCGNCTQFAVDQPERVRRLVLWDALGVGALEGRAGAVLTLANADWELFCRTAAGTLFGWELSTDVERMAAFLRASVAQEDFKRWLEGATWSTREYPWKDLRMPVLVLRHENAFFSTAESGAQVVSTVPDASLVEVEGTWITTSERAERVANIILNFFQIGSHAALMGTPSGTAIILFSDVADSTALTERLGDGAFRERARALDASLRSIITESGGTAIDGKLLGDGVLATFPSAVQAIDAAVRLGRAGDDAALPLHLGLHAGDVIREHDNVFGGAVNIAARISALTAPGEVLVSRTVADLARTSAGAMFEDRGEHALKGIADPQRVFAVVRRLIRSG